MSKKDTQNTIKPHTEAKLKFYIHYLERYLPILFNTPFVKKINIYDVFCGRGIYDDGKEGSAIREFKTIKEILSNNKGSNTKITLTLNDFTEEWFLNVSEYIKKQEKEFTVRCSNKDGAELLEMLIDGFNNRQDSSVRNLVFIDPYGYKQINKELIYGILKNGRTEAIIFLPISQMYRFKSKAIGYDTDNFYIPLRNFIEQFNITISDIDGELNFIKEIEKAFSFCGAYHSTSYHIKNQQGTYYALFFITKNIYGLEKIIEVKWQLDDQKGEGFDNNPQRGLFLEIDKIAILEKNLLLFLTEERTNNDLYEFVLKTGFTPKHANQLLKELQNKGRLIVAPDTARKGSFYINNENYKNGTKRITVKLN